MNTCFLDKRNKEAPREQAGSGPGVRVLGVAQRPRTHASAPGGGPEAPPMQPIPHTRAWEKRWLVPGNCLTGGRHGGSGTVAQPTVASSKEVNSFPYLVFIDVSVFMSSINKTRCVVFKVVQLVGHEESIYCRCVVLSESERSAQCQSRSVKQKSGTGLCTVSDKNQKIMSGAGSRQPPWPGEARLSETPLSYRGPCKVRSPLDATSKGALKGLCTLQAVGLCAHESRSHRPDWGPDMLAQCMIPRWRSLET